MSGGQVSSTTTWSSFAVARRAIALKNSRNFRESAINSTYCVAEYVAQPAAILLAAPFLVHRLGLQQYGIWMLVSAILGSMGVLSTGFGDATVKYASAYRGQNDLAGVERTMRATLTINAALGSMLGGLVWMLAPVLAHRAFKIEPELQNATIRAIQISAVILVLRSVESVFVSALRAFERYGPAVKLNVFLRWMVVISAVVLASLGRGVADIMVATLVWSGLVLVLQAVAAQKLVGNVSFLPILQRSALQEVFGFGCFSWLQALAAVAFSYADRFLVGAMLGTGPVAIYVLCVQATQPIHGLGAAGFNFLLPHLSSRHEAGEIRAPRRVFRLTMLASVGLSVVLALPLILLGKPLLALWMGPVFANQGYHALGLLALAYVLLALNVVPHYTLLALGEVRFVSIVNVLGGILSIVSAFILIPSLGVIGAALGRLLYGPATALNLLRVKSTLCRVESVHNETLAEPSR